MLSGVLYYVLKLSLIHIFFFSALEVFEGDIVKIHPSICNGGKRLRWIFKGRPLLQHLPDAPGKMCIRDRDYIVVAQDPEKNHRQNYGTYFDPRFVRSDIVVEGAAAVAPMNVRKIIARRAAMCLTRELSLIHI